MIRIGFRRHCAFWYKDIKKAEEVFNWLLNESYNKNQIINYRRGRNEWIIEYENGDIIRFIPINIFMRGQKFDESYLIDLDSVYDYDFIHQIIIPCSIYGEVYIWLGGGRRKNILYDTIKVLRADLEEKINEN